MVNNKFDNLSKRGNKATSYSHHDSSSKPNNQNIDNQNNPPNDKYISEEEARYFQNSIKDYLPTKADDIKHNVTPNINNGDAYNSGSNIRFIADTSSRLDVTGNPDELDDFKRPGLQNSKMTKLRGGKIIYSDTLDLHGMNVAEAAAALIATMNLAFSNGYESVKIIHGKGYNKENNMGVGNRGKNLLNKGIIKGKLKLYVIAWLKDNPAILGFCRALPNDGGSGAMYILLKKLTKLY